MVRVDQVFQLSLIKLLKVQFFHDVSLSEQIPIFTCNFSKLLAFIDFNRYFIILLENTLEWYLDDLLHNLVLRATVSSRYLLLRTLIFMSDKLLDRGLLIYLFLQI